MPAFRILLFPFSLLYKWVTDVRNYLYNSGRKKSVSPDRFVVCVGNLTVGGTGKTPFVELIIKELINKYALAVLSRGYKRKTHGYRMAQPGDDAAALGDEPAQYFTKFGSKIRVVVGENRAEAISEMLRQDDQLEVIILDDAYQHRRVTPKLNILLSNYYRPFYRDFVLPAGMLRESRHGARRADMVVITKCPDEISASEQDRIKKNVQKYTRPDIPILFSGIRYLRPLAAFGEQNFMENVILFTGIANATPLEDYINRYYNIVAHKKFPDHHTFSPQDIRDVIRQFEQCPFDFKCLLTTEKDMMRLQSDAAVAGLLRNYPVFYLPIELYFMENKDFFAPYLTRAIDGYFQKMNHDV